MAKRTSASDIEVLEKRLAGLSRVMLKPALIGFDGFVDSIRKAVKFRRNHESTYYSTIAEFASRIGSLAGKSGQFEMEVQRVKRGGNAPILSNALGQLGVDSICIGSMGFPDLHPVFEDLPTKCNLVSVLEPGQSDAIEFSDGKLIFSDLGNFERYDWKHVKNAVGHYNLMDAVGSSKLIALVDWSNLPQADNIWEGLLEDVIKPSGRHDYLFFFDLCDPSRKKPQEVDEILDIISSFSHYGSVTLGLNENEARSIWSALSGTHPGEHDDLPLHEIGARLFQSMKIDYLLIHPIDRVIAYHDNTITELPGRFVTKPKVQTGGGDNLNAGYCLGWLAGMPLKDCLLLGMASSGYYVENGSSADLNGLKAYCKTWRQELLIWERADMYHKGEEQPARKSKEKSHVSPSN